MWPYFLYIFLNLQVTALLQDVLRSKLQGVAYHADTASLLAKQLSDEIRDRLKEIRDDSNGNPEAGLDSRYKLVSQVFILEQRGQGVRVGQRCLWDADTDSYATASFQNEHIFAIATAYGIYWY